MTMQDLTGQILGSYQLRELIGVGGMGAVYRGYQTTLERAVAVKVLSTALANEPGYIERFYREAKTAAALEHAHIVPVHDFGIQGNLSYVVMRLLTGGTLADRMQNRADKNRPLPSLGEVAALLKQVGSALDYAHTQNVIHRDIKPSNIMFDNQGNAYLVDFGIAKLLEATSALTSTGTTMGTPAYMPPEQWRSEDLTPAADQYALGATMYSLVVGRVPYEATTPYGLMHKHLNEKPDPPHLRRSGVPEAVSLVLERALAKTPDQRFPTVTAFALAFENAISGQTGDRTGFFTTSLPVKKAQLAVPLTPSAVANLPPTQVEGGRTPTPPGSGSIPALTAAVPSRPIHRHPVVWILTLALIVALAALGITLLDGEKTTTPPAASPIAAVETEPPPATDTPAVETTSDPTREAGLVILPSHTPTDTPVPTATAAPTDTATPTYTPSPTATAVPTATETPIPTNTPRPTSTPTKTPRPTNTPTKTPRPTSTPTKTPRPTEPPPPTATPAAVVMVPGEHPVLVVGSMGAYLRESPSPDESPFTTVTGVELPIIGRSADNMWYQVEYEGRPVWVRRSVSVSVQGDLDRVPVVGERVMLVVGSMGAYLRESPSPDESPFTTVTGVELPIIGRSADNTWYQVEYEGRPVWVRRSAFVSVQGDLESVPVVGQHPVLMVSSMGAYLRELPSPDAPPYATVTGVELPIIGRSADNTWYQVEYEGRLVWVRRSSFVSVQGDLDSVPVVTPDSAVTAPPSAARPVLTIGSMGAYLRERPSFDAEFTSVSNVELPVIGRTEDNTWYQVEYEGRPVWVRQSAFVRIEGDLDSVPVEVVPPLPTVTPLALLVATAVRPPTATPAAPGIVTSGQDCGLAPNPQLQIGMAVIAAPGSGTYALYSDFKDDFPQQQVSPGTTGTVVDGPICKNGYRFWQIQFDQVGTGWMSEGTQNRHFLLPF